MGQSKTLELSIKIAGQVDKSLTAALNDTHSQISNLSKDLSRIGTDGLAAMGAFAAGTVAAITKCTNEAVQFEGYMGDVVKYVDGLADATGKISDELAENGNTFAENYSIAKDAVLDLSTQIPYTAEELTKLAAAAGQSDYSLEALFSYDENGKVQGFLKDVAMWGTAMDISAEQAGEWAAKWEKALSTPTNTITHEDIMEYADMINYLGANTPTTAAAIAGVVNDVAGLGDIAGASIPTVIALSDALLGMGVEEGKVATGLRRMLTNMSLGTSATTTQQEAWSMLGMTAEDVAKSMQNDAAGTMQAVFTAISGLEEWQQTGVLKDLFGQWAIEGAAKMTNNLQPFIDALEAVSNPDVYTGSMEREFIIKASTSESIDQMTESAMDALKIDIGDEFLPVKKQFGIMMIDVMNGIREHMPELKQLAGTLADLLSAGVSKLGEALEKALPYVQQALDYVANNGPQVAHILGNLVGVFAAMKFAPTIEKLFSGAGSLLFGSGRTASGSNGGLFGMIGNLFKGGQTAASTAGTLMQAAGIGASMANTSMTRVSGESITTTGFGGLMQTISNGVLGAIFGIKNSKSLTSKTSTDNTLWKSILGTASQITTAKENGGLLGMAKNAISNSNVGTYFSGIKTALGNVANTSIGSGIINAVKGTGGALKEVFTGIAGPEGLGLTNLVSGVEGLAKSGASWIGGNVGTLVSMVASSAPAQTVAGLIGNVASSSLGQLIGSAANGLPGVLGNLGNFASAGAGLLGSVWGPIASGFGSLFAGAAPVIGVISGIIAVVSILGDHLEDIRGIIGNVFGDTGLAVFDGFMDKLGTVGDFITGLFVDGGVANALAPLQEIITNLFGTDAGVAFSGLTTILQSVMGVIGQIVTFATGTVKPIIQEIFSFLTETVMPIILQTFTTAAPTIASIISGIGSAVMTGMQIIGSAIQAAMPIIEGLITVILNIGSVVVPALLAGIEAFSAGIESIMSAIQGIFEGLITFITGVFSGDWRAAWEGIKQIFGNAFDALVTLCKTPINAVISLINSAISGINNLGLTIPEWVPIFGGKSFSINIPSIPMLAEGGFTNGVSIAGEKATEAVISFQRNVRENNIDTWIRAGQMLGVNGKQAALAAVDTSFGRNTVELKSIDITGTGNTRPAPAGGPPIQVTYAPVYQFHGEAPTKEDLVEASRISQEEFNEFIAKWFKDHGRKDF